MIKDTRGLTENSWCTGGMPGDGVDVESASLHNLEWGGVDPKLKG